MKTIHNYIKIQGKIETASNSQYMYVIMGGDFNMVMVKNLIL